MCLNLGTGLTKPVLTMQIKYKENTDSWDGNGSISYTARGMEAAEKQSSLEGLKFQ